MKTHVYKDMLIPILTKFWKLERNQGTQLTNTFYAYLCEGQVEGHLKQEVDGRFAKTIFYFLCSDSHARYYVRINGKPANVGNGEGIQIPSSLELEGQNKYNDIY